MAGREPLQRRPSCWRSRCPPPGSTRARSSGTLELNWSPNTTPTPTTAIAAPISALPPEALQAAAPPRRASSRAGRAPGSPGRRRPACRRGRGRSAAVERPMPSDPNRSAPTSARPRGRGDRRAGTTIARRMTAAVVNRSAPPHIGGSSRSVTRTKTGAQPAEDDGQQEREERGAIGTRLRWAGVPLIGDRRRRHRSPLSADRADCRPSPAATCESRRRQRR